MPHSVSAKKRLRQSDKKRVYNKSVRSEIKTWTKRLEAAVEQKDAAGAQTLFRTVIKKIDKSVKNGIYHKNTAARKKSLCAKLVKALAAPAPAQG